MMVNAKRVLVKNCCYHLITRGNQKQKVFECDSDNLQYLKFLKKFKNKYKFKLYAYCLMPNHVHLLGEIPDIRDLSKFMHDLNRTYTLYFNAKYRKVGHLWQGRFRSRIISKDDYLIHCINYIELNPLRSVLVQNIWEYPWSSYKLRGLDEKEGIIDDITQL